MVKIIKKPICESAFLFCCWWNYYSSLLSLSPISSASSIGSSGSFSSSLNMLSSLSAPGALSRSTLSFWSLFSLLLFVSPFWITLLLSSGGGFWSLLLQPTINMVDKIAPAKIRNLRYSPKKLRTTFYNLGVKQTKIIKRKFSLFF